MHPGSNGYITVNLLMLLILMAQVGAKPYTSDFHSTDPATFHARATGAYGADVPIAWYHLAYSLVKNERMSPPVASRLFGYLGVALYEAVAPGIPRSRSLAGQLNDLGSLPRPAGKAYHWPTVANTVLAATLLSMVGQETESSEAEIRALESRFINQYKGSLPPGIIKRSMQRGLTISGAIMRWAASDGYENLKDCPYAPPSGPGLWQPTGPGYASALEPCWGSIRPFVLDDGRECAPEPLPAYSEHPDSSFYLQAWEVYETVNHLTEEQRAIILFWADIPGETGTPAGHSISILSQVLRDGRASLATAAEAYARVGIALADAFIGCWDVKYRHNVLRPISYVHGVIGDLRWNTPVVTPPFPEYTSGHSVQSAAAAEVMTQIFGPTVFTDHTHEPLRLAPRTFVSFWAFAEEAALSRLYGGIHFRAGIERGLEQGRCIGARVNLLEFKDSDPP